MTPILLGTLTLATLALGGAFGALITARIERRRRETDLDQAVLELLGDVEERLGALISTLPTGPEAERVETDALNAGELEQGDFEHGSFEHGDVEDGDVEDGDVEDGDPVANEVEVGVASALVVDNDLTDAPTIGDLLARIDERIAGLERSTPWPEERLAQALDALAQPNAGGPGSATRAPQEAWSEQESVQPQETLIESTDWSDLESESEFEVESAAGSLDEPSTLGDPLDDPLDDDEGEVGELFESNATGELEAGSADAEPTDDVELDVDTLVASLLAQDEADETPLLDTSNGETVTDVVTDEATDEPIAIEPDGATSVDAPTPDLQNSELSEDPFAVDQPPGEEASEPEESRDKIVEDPFVEAAELEPARDSENTDSASVIAGAGAEETEPHVSPSDASIDSIAAADMSVLDSPTADESSASMEPDRMGDEAPARAAVSEEPPIASKVEATLVPESESEPVPEPEPARVDEAQEALASDPNEATDAHLVPNEDAVDATSTNDSMESIADSTRVETSAADLDRAERITAVNLDVEAPQGLVRRNTREESGGAPASGARAEAFDSAPAAHFGASTGASAAIEAHDAVNAVARLTRRLQIRGIDRATRQRLLAELETALTRFRH